MRRIPRCQRAIDPSLPLSTILGHQIPALSSRRIVSPNNHLRITSVPFSTTPSLCFLLGGKQDKKKHQQFVRRWQKRLLGDSEPIGAHVDPYDPTSPVRIAPEEQGEELEVLEEQRRARADDFPLPETVYEEASDWHGLKRVGGKQWTEQLEEGNLAKEYEKLTLRTYTPLSLKMADHIEDLTGTPYTLRDENLMMAQTFHDFTNKPYTDSSFGRWTRVRGLNSLRENFHRAVTEIYALKQAGRNLDLSASSNRGIYDTPGWLKEARLQKTPTGDFELVFPTGQTLEALIQEIQRIPEWSPEQGLSTEEALLADEGEVEPLTEQAAPSESPPTMDPETPSFRRAALVKQDPNKKAFDFMSNRPVPRAPTVAPHIEAVVEAKEMNILEELAESKSVPLTPAAEIEVVVEALEPSSLSVGEEPPATAGFTAQSERHDIAVPQDAVRGSVPPLSNNNIIHSNASVFETEAKWRHVPLTDVAIKFALTKRLAQLTGLYVSDPHITSVDTLGDLYHHYCVVARPEPNKVNDYIHVEGERLNHKDNQLSPQALLRQKTFSYTPNQRPHVGTLFKLGNVEIHNKRPNARQQRTKIGLNKVIYQELKQQDLLERPQLAKKERNRVRRDGRMIEGTRVAPSFGTAVSPDAAQLLKERTKRKKDELFEGGNDLRSVDRLVWKSNRPQMV